VETGLNGPKDERTLCVISSYIVRDLAAQLCVVRTTDRPDPGRCPYLSVYISHMSFTNVTVSGRTSLVDSDVLGSDCDVVRPGTAKDSLIYRLKLMINRQIIEYLLTKSVSVNLFTCVKPTVMRL